MSRRPEDLSGLLVLGPATIGAIPVEIPEILWSTTNSEPPTDSFRDRLVLTVGVSGRPGHRAVQISRGSLRFKLEFPIPAPEVAGRSGSAHEAAPRCWFLHWPIPSPEWARIRETRPELVALGNGRQLFQEGESFVRALAEVRKELGAEPLLWVPRVGLPHRLPMLAWLGVDLVDATEAAWREAEGQRLDPTFGIISGTPDPGSSWTSRAGGGPPGPGSTRPAYREAMSAALEDVRFAARSGRLRELVESRMVVEPILAEILRYADRHLATYLEERTPVVSPLPSRYVVRESRRRPEVLRFRARLLERYRPPPSKRILLLVPCSRTKPYRNSPSHRKIRRTLESVPGSECVHWVSVTSPLGLVPRELEDVYPARHYDVPVTGEWDEDERSAVSDALDRLKSTGGYSATIVHLDRQEYGWLRDRLPESEAIHWTVKDGRTTSSDSLANLRESVASELTKGGTNPPTGRLAVVREELASIGTIQFGPDAARQLFGPPFRVQGRPWSQRILDVSGTTLASWHETRGLFQLTVAGGLRMRSSGLLEVEVDPTLSLQGDLFAPGVVHSDPAIRVGDAVLLTQRSEVVAVGEAALPGPLMTQLAHGLAVRIRHRRHSESVSAPSTPT